MTRPALETTLPNPIRRRLRAERARWRGHRQHRSVAPRDARDDPGDRRARRREDQPRGRPLRVPAPRLREGVRIPHVAQPDPVRGPAQLLLGADQQLRVLRRRRAADGHRDHAALPLPAHAAFRVFAHRGSPHLHRRLADGARRDDGLPVPGDDPRLRLRASRRAHRRARHLHLRPHRRAGARLARRLARAARRDPDRVREVHRTHPRADGPQPHLHRPYAQHRRDLGGGRRQLGVHRSHAALDRPAASTCARTPPILPMPSSISTCRSASTATTTIATTCACARWTSRST